MEEKVVKKEEAVKKPVVKKAAPVKAEPVDKGAFTPKER